MPFKSEAQRKFMWENHPNIARKWELEEKNATPVRNKTKARRGYRRRKRKRGTHVRNG